MAQLAVCPWLNLPYKISTVNFKNRLSHEIKAFSEEQLQEFIQQGAVIKKNKQYRLVLHYRQFTIECPILHMDDGSYRMIWPAFLLPNRPYPAFVYLFAAAPYLSSGKSQRATAGKIRSFFGLTTFCHTTIGRFLLRFFPILPYLIKCGAQITNNWGLNKSHFTPRKHWDKSQNALADEINQLIEPALRAPPEFGSWLASQYWLDTLQFIV